MDEQNDSSWQYKPDQPSQPGQTFDSPVPVSTPASKESTPGAKGPVSWSASEYIDHTHGIGWYAVLAVGTIGLGVGIYFLTKDYFAAGVIAILGVIVGVFAARKPKEITYDISSSGIKVGEKSYNYSQFKSFSLIREGSLSSINLLPLKKFMPPISAYFPPNDEQRIVNSLGNYLPYEERKMDGVDRLTRRLRL